MLGSGFGNGDGIGTGDGYGGGLGNGTGGGFAPEALKRIGCDVIEMDCALDYTFPNYNPNPEDLEMLHAMRDAVLAHKADVALGFDGDGDRCGVVGITSQCHRCDRNAICAENCRDLQRLKPSRPAIKCVADDK